MAKFGTAAALQRRQWILHKFTLVELMVGMTILSIMMLMMFKFIIAAQRAAAWSDKYWRIYENTQVILDLLERDLESCIVSGVPGEEIIFYAGAPDSVTNSLLLCFVASIEPDADASSKYCEVSYKFHTNIDPDSSLATLSPYTLYRQVISEADGSLWNFLGAPAGWYENGSSGFEIVVSGVEEITFLYNGDEELSEEKKFTEKPTTITIEVKVIDEYIIDLIKANAPTEQIELLKSRTRNKGTRFVNLSQNQGM